MLALGSEGGRRGGACVCARIHTMQPHAQADTHAPPPPPHPTPPPPHTHIFTQLALRDIPAVAEDRSAEAQRRREMHMDTEFKGSRQEYKIDGHRGMRGVGRCGEVIHKRWRGRPSEFLSS